MTWPTYIVVAPEMVTDAPNPIAGPSALKGTLHVVVPSSMSTVIVPVGVVEGDAP